MSSWLASLGLGAKPVDPLDQVKEWKRGISKEVRHLERDIRALEREEAKHQKECERLAKTDRKAALIVAKSIVQARKAKEKMYLTRASMKSLEMQISNQAAVVKAAGCLQRSTAVMGSLNDLMKIGKMSEDMHAMMREMERAGIVEEALSEGLEDAFGSEELDAEADGEVNKVLDELLNEQFSGVASVPTSAPAAAAAEPNLEASEPAAVSATEEDEEIAALQSRLEGL
eukprot:CAMPEP_0118961964 /NCGR_PEP_ID=MMETSP1173-20130426/471_1 /TAXON_ID=1034831 /ORGANISM="Rhizochromulina marina cf, Strain CCMP1243" /LENGTH=228 /DNA_ID=CAMNT_0006910173 /DNA_START=24 /DNA_END=710 /DNA_ORIENTATION=+